MKNEAFGDRRIISIIACKSLESDNTIEVDAKNHKYNARVWKGNFVMSTIEEKQGDVYNAAKGHSVTFNLKAENDVKAKDVELVTYKK